MLKDLTRARDLFASLNMVEELKLVGEGVWEEEEREMFEETLFQL